MASYRYERDIDPKDIAPRKERQYTRKERWANWWDYNLKWVIIIGVAAAFVAYNFIGQYFFVTKPDYNVAVVAPYYLPEDTVNALQDALAAYGEDRNGDGKVVVTLNVYTLDYSDTETQTESAAYLTMAGTTKLATDVQGLIMARARVSGSVLVVPPSAPTVPPSDQADARPLFCLRGRALRRFCVCARCCRLPNGLASNPMVVPCAWCNPSSTRRVMKCGLRSGLQKTSNRRW